MTYYTSEKSPFSGCRKDDVCCVWKPPTVRKPPPLLYLATQTGQLCALKDSLERAMTHQDEFSQPYWWQSVSVTVVSAVSESLVGTSKGARAIHMTDPRIGGSGYGMVRSTGLTLD